MEIHTEEIDESTDEYDPRTMPLLEIISEGSAEQNRKRILIFHRFEENNSENYLLVFRCFMESSEKSR